MRYDDDDRRILRVLEALEAITPAAHSNGRGYAHLEVHEKRIKALCGELAPRSGSLDAVELLVSRSLLRTLQEALLTCRKLTTEASEQLRLAGGVVRETVRMIERHRQHAEERDRKTKNDAD